MPQNLLDANLNYLFQSRLIDGEMVAGRATPIGTMITPAGIDVVEKPSDASHYSVNLHVLQVATNYGQIAQASQNSTVAQTQTVTFGSLRRMVRDRDEICESEKAAILGILDGLENDARRGTLTKTAIEKTKQALTKYAWLMQPLMVLLKAYFGFP